jgi:hypothetical protein
MGIFDAFKNALANDDSLGAPPPDGLSQDPWLNGMRKPIYINFVKDGGKLLLQRVGIFCTA